MITDSGYECPKCGAGLVWQTIAHERGCRSIYCRQCSMIQYQFPQQPIRPRPRARALEDACVPADGICICCRKRVTYTPRSLYCLPCKKERTKASNAMATKRWRERQDLHTAKEAIHAKM